MVSRNDEVVELNLNAPRPAERPLEPVVESRFGVAPIPRSLDEDEGEDFTPDDSPGVRAAAKPH